MSRAEWAVAAAGAVLVLLVAVFFVPAVTFTRQVDFGASSHPVLQQVEDQGSLGFLLFGVGTAPFTHPIVRIVTINGSLYTLNYSITSVFPAEMRPGTPVSNPLVLEAAQAVLNNSGIAYVYVVVGLKNAGSQPVSLVITVDKTSYAAVKDLGANQTRVVTIRVYAFPTPRP